MNDLKHMQGAENKGAIAALDHILGKMSGRVLLTREEEVAYAHHVEEGEAMILKALASSPAALRELAAMGGELAAGKLRMRDLMRDSDEEEVADAGVARRLAQV